jgi:hypothetical protein
MGVLGDTFRAGALEVDRIEAELAAAVASNSAQASEIEALKQALADCQGVPPPPDDWPTGGVLIRPEDNLGVAVSANPAGTMFRFMPGIYGFSQPLPLKGGNTYIADDPSNLPKLVGSGPAGFPFAHATVGNVTLKGLDVSFFGPANTTEGGSMVNKADGSGNAAGVNWLIEDCVLGDTNNGIVRWGSGWTINRTVFHDGGRYALHGGGMQGVKLLKDCEWRHIGYVASDNNRGGSKFAVTSGIVIDGLWVHDIRGSGVWFDIKNENGKIANVLAEDCTRMGINLEVSYGPFVIENPIMRRCGSDKKSSEGADWPIPGGMQLSMTPDVTVTNPLVEDCRNGITVIQWNHPQILGTIGTLDASKCGNENIVINGGKITRCAEWEAGLAGNRPAGTRPTKNVHWNDVTFDSDAKFRSALHI